MSQPLPAPEHAANGNVADLLSGAAAAHPDRSAVIGSGGVRSWDQLNKAADAGAVALTELGLHQGDRVVVCLPTGADILAAMFAIARAGLVAVPVAPDHVGLASITERVGAAAVIGDNANTAGLAAVTSKNVADWWSAPSSGFAAVAGGEDLAFLARASGSDRPVMISHRAILAAVSAIGSAPSLGLRPDDRALLVLPLYHLAGWVTAFLPLCAVGAAAVVPDLPEQSGQWIDSVTTAVRTHRATVVPAAPTLYRRLRTADQVERALASVRLMTSGASPLDPEDLTAIRRVTGQPVWEGYGISESAAAVSSSLMTSAPRPGSVGRPLPGIELRILGDTASEQSDIEPSEVEPAGSEPADIELLGVESTDVEPGDSEAIGTTESAVADGVDDVPDSEIGSVSPETPSAAMSLGAGNEDIIAEISGEGEVGEIAIRGATLFSGYWPDGADGPDHDGWFATGDIGYLDDQGELHLVDRVGEALTVAGFTVYPREVEEVLTTHPYVRDAAVVGVPWRSGEAVLAVLVAQRGKHPTAEDLDEFVATRLPAFKRPTRYRLVDRLPRSAVGRVDRDEVRRNYLADPDPDGGTPIRLALGEPAAAAGQAPVAGEGPAAGEALRAVRRLASRLPGAGARGRRSAGEVDEELF